MDKTAVDQAAKDYWKLLYGEYGEALVRDIPRRIKAALVANKKIASVDDEATVKPFAVAAEGDSIFVEGLYTASGKKLLFSATLDKEGNVSDVNSVELR